VSHKPKNDLSLDDRQAKRWLCIGLQKMALPVYDCLAVEAWTTPGPCTDQQHHARADTMLDPAPLLSTRRLTVPGDQTD
jgi:hypothetical protein